MPNPSIEGTSKGWPLAAPHVKRWASFFIVVLKRSKGHHPPLCHSVLIRNSTRPITGQSMF